MNRCLLLLCVSQVSLWSVSVRADAVDDALAQIEEGELDAALQSLDGAQPSTRAQYLRMLEARARIAFARRDDAALGQALRALDALAPDYRFGRSVPPDLGDQLQAMNTPPLTLEVEVRDLGSGSRLSVRLDDAAGLVEGTQLHVRAGDQQLETRDSTLVVPIRTGGRVQIWAEAVGPGGVVLATYGTAETPHEHIRPGTPAELAEGVQLDLDEEEESNPPGTRRRRGIIAAFVVAIVVVLAAGAIAGYYVADSNRRTRLGNPRLD